MPFGASRILVQPVRLHARLSRWTCRQWPARGRQPVWGGVMDVAVRRSARRELAVVVAMAVFGIALVSLVAFTPWYSPDAVHSAAVSAGRLVDQLLNLLTVLFR